MSSIAEVKDLVKYYHSGSNIVKVVDHIMVVFERNRFTAIIGRSGSGKSTLLHVLGGLEKLDSGSVKIDKTDLYEMKPDELAVFRR